MRQLKSTAEGRAARAYLENRGLNAETIAGFGIGYAPSGGDVLLRQLKPNYAEKLLVESGVISRDHWGRACSTASAGELRFRLRTNPERSRRSAAARWATTCRSISNSPETPIYSESELAVSHGPCERADPARQDFAILVEGYMDAIAVARAGIGNVVASCGTSLAVAANQIAGRFTKRRRFVNQTPTWRGGGDGALADAAAGARFRGARAGAAGDLATRKPIRIFSPRKRQWRRTSNCEGSAAVCRITNRAGTADGPAPAKGSSAR